METEIKHVNSGEIRFKQGESVVNYGDATITTYNLVNCIAIGGRFAYKEGRKFVPYEEQGPYLNGIFFTHESPTDKEEHKLKLSRIKEILKDAFITEIFVFRIHHSQADQTRYTSGYASGSTTEEIIDEMIRSTTSIFGIEPKILVYSCDIKTFRCGKASISVDSVRTNIESMTMNSMGANVTEEDSSAVGTFEPTYLKNQYGDTVIQCPICGNISGTSLEITHNYNCIHRGKRADLSHKPAEGGSRNMKRKRMGKSKGKGKGKTYKSSKHPKRRITRHSKPRSK
jgi:hypothetical protein